MKTAGMITLALLATLAGCSADFIGMHCRFAVDQKAADFRVSNAPTTQAVELGSLDSKPNPEAIRAISAGVVDELVRRGLKLP